MNQSWLPAQISLPFTLRGFYFLTFFGLGVYAPYMSIFLKSRGLSGAEVGTVWALLPLGAVIAPPLWGMVADKFRNRKILIISLTLVSGVLFACLLGTRTFWVLAGTLFLYSTFRSSTLPLVESATLEYLSHSPRENECGRIFAYGDFRLWGGVGFILASLTIGYLVDAFSIRMMVYVYLVAAAVQAFLGFALPSEGGERQDRLGSEIVALLKRKDFVTFLLAGFILRASHGPMWTFLPIHLRELGFSGWTIGWSFSVGVIAEVIFLIFSHRFLKRFGVKSLLMAASGGAALRWWLYSLAQEPWSFLAISLLHSLTFAAFHVASVTFVERVTPNSLKSSGQAFFSASTYGGGGIAGALLSGVLIGPLGFAGLLMAAAVVALLSMVIYGLALPRRNA